MPRWVARVKNNPPGFRAGARTGTRGRVGRRSGTRRLDVGRVGARVVARRWLNPSPGMGLEHWLSWSGDGAGGEGWRMLEVPMVRGGPALLGWSMSIPQPSPFPTARWRLALVPWSFSMFPGCGGIGIAVEFPVFRFASLSGPRRSCCSRQARAALLPPGASLSSPAPRGFNLGENRGADGAQGGCPVTRGTPVRGRDLVALCGIGFGAHRHCVGWAPASPSGFPGG